MNKYRIIQKISRYGKVEYFAQVRERFLFIPFWSTIYYASATKNFYYGSAWGHDTQEEADRTITKHMYHSREEDKKFVIKTY
jgi:hypothetical protein